MKKKNWIRIAVPIAIALILVIVFQLMNQKTTEVAAIGEKKTVIFPEVSALIMNADSKVKYDKETFKEKRIVYLDGEAKFNVSRNNREKGGFLVKTNQGLVRAASNRFNVYSRKDGFRVECYQGTIEVRKNDKIVPLEPGSRLTWSDEQQDFIEDKHYRDEPAWFLGEGEYKETPLDEVVREIERQYGLKFILDLDTVPNFTGSFPHKDLQTTMDNIVEPFGFKYLQDGAKMRIWEE